MFQPETEDMLPRMAPKPSPDVISGTSEAIIRPQVPEVSILFGQQDANYQQKIFNNPLQQQKGYPPQTYAAWKKQMLPKVTFPADANTVESKLQENNLGRTGYNCTTTNINPNQLNTCPVMNVASNVFGSRNESVEVGNPLTYRRSLESCNNNCYQPIQNFPVLSAQTPLASLQPLSNSRSKEILTICASTQTDLCFESTNNWRIPDDVLSNLATKKDVANICHVLDELKAEQQRIVKLLETIAFSQYSQMVKAETYRKDVCLQTDMDDPPDLNGDIAFFQNHQSVPKNKFVEHLKPNSNIHPSPKGKPIAQSTAYRTNSPQNNLKYDLQCSDSFPVYQESNKPTEINHKSSSDTTFAMNELALKYLPNEKLAELLKELNMDCPTVTPENIEPTPLTRENFDKIGKGASDISNASYKYLKKYRLLPEDHVESRKNSANGPMQNNIENQTPLYNSPQYVQNLPINHRQTPTNKCSPFAADRLPLSPLARASPSSSPSTMTHQIVDLDNIKQQPKFL